MVHVQVVNVPVGLERRKTDDIGIMFRNKDNAAIKTGAPAFHVWRVASPNVHLLG